MHSNRNKFLKFFLMAILATSFWFSGNQIVNAQPDLGLSFAEQIGLNDQDPRVTTAKVIRFGLGFLGIIAVCLLLYAGFLWMNAGGNDEKISKAKKILINATIGLIIILASFGIVSFILSRLITATGGGGGGVCSPSCLPGEYCCGGACQATACSGLGGGTAFTVSSTIPTSGMSNLPRNTVIRYKFNDNVRATSVDDTTFTVFEEPAHTVISGTRTVNGRYIEFVPDALCPPPNDTLHCLPSTMDISVTAIDGSIVSNSGKNLDCRGAPCAIDFTTGNYVDTQSPRININSQQVCAAVGNIFDASATDDYGLSKIDFFVEGTSVGSQANTPPPLSPFNASVIWDGSSFTVGQNILLKATAYDFDSNETSAQKNIRVSAGHCCNGIQDGNETGVDCGGSCLACNGGACAPDLSQPGVCSDQMCSSDFCSANGSTQAVCEAAGFAPGTTNCCLCQSKPKITSISPLGGFCSSSPNTSCTVATAMADCGSNSCDMATPNGNTGNFITISGSGFGTTRGKVIFMGRGGVEVEAVLADDPVLGNTDCRANVWTPNQIIAIVPNGVINGKIIVESSSQARDATDDSNGSLINDFLLNTIDRPGLCLVNPNSGKLNDVIDYSGIKLNASEAYFGSLSQYVIALNSIFTQPKDGTAEVPNLQAGQTTTYVFKSGVISNFLDFTKDNEPSTGPQISSIEPSSGPIGQYVTIRGSGFGSSKGNSKIYFGGISDPEADYNFPDVCAQSVWTDRQIIVKVPNGVRVGSYILTLEKSGESPVDSGSQTFQVTTGSPDPGLCRIDPSLGQTNNTVTFWGEYFQNQNSDSKIRFYNNQLQTGAAITFWNIDTTATGIKPWKVVTKVPTGAVSGPVRVEVGSPSQFSNTLNFSVGLCTRNEDCGGTDTCCAAGLPEAGRCKADAAQCFGVVATSVYEWEFSTGYRTLSCAPDQQQCGNVCCAGDCDDNDPGKCAACDSGQNECGDGSCCNGPCIPGDGSNPSFCAASCSGYVYNQCIEGYFCPNSPGQCSPTRGSGLPVPTGQQCGDNFCQNSGPDCLRTNSCEYNPNLNRCVKTASSTNSCSAKNLRDDSNTIILSNNNPIQGQCVSFNNALHWEINWSTSCPSGWARGASNVCIDINDINGACSICGNGQTCLMDGDRGVCAVGNAVCASGSTCDLADNECKKTDTGTCECCCRIDNAAQDCCAGLSCDGSCGTGPRLGYCSGCVVGGVADDSLCNCSGSDGKICDASVDPRGRCVDCSAISDPAECSSHARCCVDGRNGENKCTSITGTQPIVPEIIGGATVNFCGFFQCTGAYPNSCDASNPTKNGPYKTIPACGAACVDAPIPCGTQNNCSIGPSCPTGMTCDLTSGGSSCVCKPDGGAAGQSCVDPNNAPACMLTGGCKTGYTCLDDTPTDPTCRCCCKPPVGGAPDTCKDIDPNLSCLADQGLCTGGSRGQCCGCSKDSQCGDVTTTGCGTTGARCCSSRPSVTDHYPLVDATEVCRNASIEAVFDQKMNISSFNENSNVQLIGDYGSSPCPSGYPIIASNAPTSRWAQLLQPVKRVLVKIAPFLLTRPTFADMSNFCVVSGTAIGSEVSATKTKVSFRLLRPLEANRKFYVVLKGDPDLNAGSARVKDFYNEYIKSITNVGMVGVPRGRYIPGLFNHTEFKNAEIWTFTTSAEICSLDSVKVNPDFHLFQQTGQEVFLNTSARARNGQVIQSISSVYDWSWNWSSGNNNIAQVQQQADPLVALATAGNAKDAMTLGKASSTITVDTINQVSSVGKVTAGVSQLRLFLCENPWPVYFAIPGYVWPWKDSATGVEFYYCRDDQGVGTSDDLPALEENPLIGPTSRKICMIGANSGNSCVSDTDCSGVVGSCLPEVLKEFFFFREQSAQVPVINGVVDPLGGQVNLDWAPTHLAAKYKVYYGTSSGRYTSNVEVPAPRLGNVTKSISGLVNGVSYYFAVTAITDKNQETVFSNELRLRPTDSTAPGAPSIIGSGADQRIALFWNEVPEAASYIAYLKVDPNSPDYPVSKPVRNIPAPNSPNVIFSSLDNTGTYYLAVKSVDLYGNISPYSSEITVNPNTPYLISAVPERGATPGQIRLKWLPFVGAQGYTIKYTSSILRTPVEIDVNNSTFDYRVTNLNLGSSYQFSITAKKANNQSSNESNQINAVAR